ncbi:TPA: DUF3830 family protein [Candidatus Bathyarchaeota archaeon]|nr:DUF3830 family protein [Candidatus Bathyarchaeota archaeon]
MIIESVGETTAEITKERNPRTAEAVINALPIEGRANRWGDEIYFSIPVRADEENSQVVTDLGDIAYWPPGNALCIFFGPTPVSRGDEPRAYSPVNVIGKVKGDLSLLRRVRGGERVKITMG